MTGPGQAGADTELDANPLLERSYRIPFHRIRAEDVKPGVREALAQAQEAVDALA